MLSIWVMGAICAFLGAICYSELGVNLPSSGGEYVYLTRAFGPTWGFMTGWVSFFAGFSGPIALAALAFSDYLGYFSRQSNRRACASIGRLGRMDTALGRGADGGLHASVIVHGC